MSIDNYSDLQAEIANWLKRNDLTNDIETFINLAEARFNRIIRTMDMEIRSQATADDEFLGLPSDWMEVREVHIVDSDRYPLKYVTPQQFTFETRRNETTGNPYLYTVIDSQLRIFPAPTATSTYDFEITYVQRIPHLTDSATTNWLLTNNPDIYLFGSLVAAEPFLYNETRLGVWKSQVNEAIEELNVASGKTRIGAGPLLPRVSNVV